MSINGQANLNIGAQNQQSGSDSLYVAFNKIQNNFTTLFSHASTYDTFIGGAGISASSDSTAGTVTLVNTGVLNITPGTGITLSGSNGNVTVSVSGNVTGALVAGVTNVGLTSNTLSVSNSPIVGAGNINIELPRQNSFAAGTYVAATVTVDQNGVITNIANTESSGTVTSVGISGVDGIAVSGGPITSSGVFEITNTGVLSLTAGTGITLSGQTGNITISAGLDRDVGTVTRVGIDSTTLSVSGGSITTNGNITVELPTDANFSGNIGIGGNLSVNGRANFNGVTNLGNLSNVVILGGSSGQVLQTDGTGNLSWTAQTGGGGGSATIGGTSGQIQFNDAGSFAGNSNLTFTKASGKLTATLFAGSGANLTNINGANIVGNIPNANITTSLQVGASANITGSANIYGYLSVSGYAYAQTPTAGASNTIVATTAFVTGAISTATSILATDKANIASPALTGTPTAPTASISSTPSTQIATTAYVNNFVTTAIASSFSTDNNKANIASPDFTGIPTANTASSGTNSRQLATTAFVYNALSSIPSVPKGSIVMWSGSVSTIPAGFTLCDGTNGTPDLRNRFVLGAGSTYSVNQTGGTKDAVVVSHTHTAYVTDPGHKHGLHYFGTPVGGGLVSTLTGIVTAQTTASTTFIDAVTQSGYGISSSVTGITVSNSTEGVSGVDQNLPPYFALCFIMSTGVSGTAPAGTDLTPYALKDSPTFIGTPTAPTPASSDNSTKIATTAFVKSVTVPDLSIYAPIQSPTFTGNPSAPTPSANDSSTKLATTEFVATQTFGYGQTWQNLTSSRAIGTTYTNSTGKPIAISVGVNATGSGAAVGVTINGVTVSIGTFCYAGNAPSGTGMMIIPKGATYSCFVTGNYNSLTYWSELR
jgi:hypothetical protein